MDDFKRKLDILLALTKDSLSTPEEITKAYTDVIEDYIDTVNFVASINAKLYDANSCIEKMQQCLQSVINTSINGLMVK